MDRNGWLAAFLATLAIETPVYLLALRRIWPPGRALLVVIAANVLTHPLAWITITMSRRPFEGVFITVESSVCILEALLLWSLGRTRWFARPVSLAQAIGISLVANGLSAGLGLLV